MFQDWLKRHAKPPLQCNLEELKNHWAGYGQADDGLFASVKAIKGSRWAEPQRTLVEQDLKAVVRDYQTKMNLITGNTAVDLAQTKALKQTLLEGFDGAAGKLKNLGVHALNRPTPPDRKNGETVVTMRPDQGGVYCSVYIVFTQGAVKTEKIGETPHAPPLTPKTKHAEKLWKDGGTEAGNGGRDIKARGDALINRIAALWTLKAVVERVEFNITQKPCDESCEEMMKQYRTKYENNLQNHKDVPFWLWTYANNDQRVYLIKGTGIFECATWE